jgi:hypothetical protein
MRTMNKAEQRALKKLWTRIEIGRPRYRDFRQLAYYNNMMGCWMILWHGMWIGIEKDGYTHS